MAEHEETSTSKDPQPVFESPPPPPPSRTSSTPPPSPPPPSDSGGINWAGAILGAILGAVLAIILINFFGFGFARAIDVDGRIDELDSTVNTLQTNVTNLSANQDALSEQLDEKANTSDLDDLSNSTTSRIDAIEVSQGDMDGAITTAQDDITTLQDSDVEMSGRIDEVAETAETFDTFLLNLRDLLNTLDGEAVEETPDEEMEEPAEGEEEGAVEEEEEVTEATGEMTLLDLAAEDGDFTIMLELIAAAGLTETLSADGPFTIFAPSDDVFDDLPPGIIEELVNRPDILTAILTYHVVEGENLAEDIANYDMIFTLQGETIEVNATEQGIILNSMASVVDSDLVASNGVIHVIDNLLFPPSFLEEPEGDAGMESEEEAGEVEEATPTATPEAEEEAEETPEATEEAEETPEATEESTGEEETPEPTPITVEPTPTP